MRKFSSAELAAILAGLRLLQEGLITGTLLPAIQDILCASNEAGLSPEEIDELCERLNLANAEV